MTKSAYYSGSPFEQLAGYARAIRQGDHVFVSGTAGYDFATGTIAESAADQTLQALKTIEKALRDAGCGLDDVVSLIVYLSDRAWIDEVSAVVKQAFPKGLLTNTTLIVTLTMPEMKVELGVTAISSTTGQ